MINMKKVNYAAIDIGSNAVRLLIKCVNEENAPELMSKVQLIRVPLRLGEDAFTTGVISAEKEKKLVRLMKAYKQLMKIYDVVNYRACATSAMRDAKNGEAIARQIAKKTGIRVEIIGGQEEAHIVYDNHIEQLFASGQNYLYVDVGGGSTEINLISNGELKSSRSYNIGTVRMLSGMVKEEEKEALRTDLAGLATEYAPIHIIGSGGNINKLFRLADKKDKKTSSLPVESLRKIHETLKELPLEQRIKQYKLKPDRADVIVPAAEIFLEVATHSQSTEIIVPTIGLSDGIIDSLYTRDMKTSPVTPS
ncbi:Ppx/GppA family phosphatase [uncultured Bacteroides sp.]|jgi:Exopolyphosphatase|uniref:Ppx/GppA phosphatase family protein n=1 Tax=uncultured Bacteroides sp. TaxID=162156 RepID=UPI00267513CB|nr:Ppx/GppA family phosphatase [uncultured Bacteroides sp.]